jgi:hypothetical protein
MSDRRWRINWTPILVWGTVVALWVLFIWRASASKE